MTSQVITGNVTLLPQICSPVTTLGCLSASDTTARAMAVAACRVAAVTMLMICSAVCALMTPLAPLAAAAWLAALANWAGSGNGELSGEGSARRAPQGSGRARAAAGPGGGTTGRRFARRQAREARARPAGDLVITRDMRCQAVPRRVAGNGRYPGIGQNWIVASMVRRRDWLAFSDLAPCPIGEVPVHDLGPIADGYTHAAGSWRGRGARRQARAATGTGISARWSRVDATNRSLAPLVAVLLLAEDQSG